ncbi:MAG TPA: D-glucuronyl C5-epimerase family protein [Terriglobales bacterium]|nr:D-glucuronyl C5-epimerase family protein [Terriglobales bacterium]
MSLSTRWHYYRRIFGAYLFCGLGSGRSQLTFWHETPEINPRATPDRLAEYYMVFREKADYAGPYDAVGIPMLDYHGAIGLQYNPIAIAQWGLANYNRFCATGDETRWQKTLKAADWLVASLEQNSHGLWVWNHHFDWEYRDTLTAPWYSGLAQGQGVSLLLRAYAHARSRSEDEKYQYQSAAEKAFVALTKPIAEGGVLLEDAEKNLWIEEYLVDPPTHILNGFMWALWGVFDYWLARADAPARKVFDRGVETLIHNVDRFDTGYWSLYEQSGTRLKMLASPFYHQLHIVQLRVMSKLTGDDRFAAVADRWEGYARRRGNRTRALVEKSVFKLLHY